MAMALWERVKQLAADALEQDSALRARFVERACEGDTELYREVMRLVAAAESSGHGFLSHPPLEVKRILAQLLPPPSIFEPGQIVADRFQILRFLSRGGMGEVYSASQLDLQQTVALKTIRPEIASANAAIEHFKDEVRQSRQITHPNVCRMYDIFSHEQASAPPIWFLTMELLEGPTLAEHLAARGPLPTDKALSVLLEIIAGLAAAHELKIAHRDFKPSNVMLVGNEPENRRTVITDFGMARNASNGTDSHRGGTPAYMSPEQTHCAVNLATDQFALGLVICDILTGEHPELDRTSATRSALQLRAWLRSVPARRIISPFRGVVRRCLQFHPEKRFAHIGDITHILDGRRHHARVRTAWTAGIAAVALTAAAAPIATQDWDDRLVEAAALTSEMDLSSDPSLTSDGKLIAFNSDRAGGGNLNIWIQSLPGGAAKRLTANRADDKQPSLSADGRFVAFRSERNGGGVYIIGADGTGERLLAPAGRHPVFSPDGRSVAYWVGSSEDTVPSGQIYVVASSGGAPHRVAADFVDARFPTWSSDGRLLLFDGCRSASQFPAGRDWWLIRPDGTAPVKLGVATMLQAEHIGEQVEPVKAWRQDRVIFSGRQGTEVPLWEIGISPKSLRVTARPRRLNSGAKDLMPALAESGAVAFGRASGALHVWRISTKPSADKESNRRITDDPSPDLCPTVSGDGRLLFFVRRENDLGQILVRDLAAGKESVFLNSGENKFWPTPNATGDSVAFESRGPEQVAIDWISHDHAVHTLCAGCAHPNSWFANHGVLYTTAKGEIALASIAGGPPRIVLSPKPGLLLGDPDWNPARDFLLFTATKDSASRQVFAIRFPRNADSPKGPWIPVSGEGEWSSHPRWSSDGAKVFYLSARDGSLCIWAQRFDAHRGATGEPFELTPFHTQRFSPTLTGPAVLGISTAGDSLYINVGEVIVSIWTGFLRPPLAIALLRKVSAPLR